MDFTNVIDKLEKSDFFSNMGTKDSLGDNIIFIKGVEQAFVNPDTQFSEGNQDMIWLPSSLTDQDPFYGPIDLPKDITESRKEIYKIILRQTRYLAKERFSYHAHDFRQVARTALAYAYRQYLLEQRLDLGEYWQRIVEIYESGHWPIAYSGGKLFVI